MLERKQASFDEVRTRLDNLTQVLRPDLSDSDPESSQTPPRELLRGHEAELHEWIAWSRLWLSQWDQTLADHIVTPLEKEEANTMIDNVGEFRAKLDHYVFDRHSTLRRISLETHLGAKLRKDSLEASFRSLVVELRPYYEIEMEHAQNKFGGSTNPAEIRHAIRQRILDSHRIGDEFAAYRVSVETFLNELARLIDEHDEAPSAPSGVA